MLHFLHPLITRFAQSEKPNVRATGGSHNGTNTTTSSDLNHTPGGTGSERMGFFDSLICSRNKSAFLYLLRSMYLHQSSGGVPNVVCLHRILAVPVVWHGPQSYTAAHIIWDNNPREARHAFPWNAVVILVHTANFVGELICA